MSPLQAGSPETLSAFLLEVQTTSTVFSASGLYSPDSPVGEPSLAPPRLPVTPGQDWVIPSDLVTLPQVTFPECRIIA